MKVTLCMEMSLNGMIARENGDEDFIPDSGFDNWLATIRDTGYVIWGRKTHDVVLSWKQTWQDALKDLKIIVVSSDDKYLVDSRFIKVSGPQEALGVFAKLGAENAILSGGSELNSSFAKLGLIDEILVRVGSVVVGKGIPLFSSEPFDLTLENVDTKKLPNGEIELRYRVVK